MNGTDLQATVPTPARWLARGALVAALAAIVVLAVADVQSLRLALSAAAAIVIMLVGAWLFLSRRGVVRWLGAVVAILAPLAVVVAYAFRDVLWAVIVICALVIVTLLLARAAFRSRAAGNRGSVDEAVAPAASQPYLIMNPRSGGGKVGRFELVPRAAAHGAEVTLLEGPEYQDVALLAEQAADRGADLLGVAGGDGTQALVAAVAAQRGLPFVVLSAGTRNHFAMDLGLDREDPSTGLDALTDGTEVKIDLGDINGRTFVNNASFGAYAAIVQSPAYRDDKRGTTLRMLPDLLGGTSGPHLIARIDDVTIEGITALLVSNNTYDFGDIAGLGRRDRMDAGVLGVIALTVNSALQAADLIRGTTSSGLRRLTAQSVVVDSDQDEIAVGIDGEAIMVSTPVRCTIRPGALRVHVPRTRPGVRPKTPSVDPVGLVRMALGRY